jgi:hypothetical protein
LGCDGLQGLAPVLALHEPDLAAVNAAVRQNTKGAERPGPLKTALDSQALAEVHLLTNYPRQINRLHSSWLGHAADIHEVELVSTID